MKSLLDFENPVTGNKVSLTNPGKLLGLFGGMVVLMLLWGFATYAKNWIVAKLPSNVGQAATGGSGSSNFTIV